MPDVAMTTRLGRLMVQHLHAFQTETSPFPGESPGGGVKEDAEEFTFSLEDPGAAASSNMNAGPGCPTTPVARSEE